MDKSDDRNSKYASFFDSYLDEIIYIFENCSKDIVVFEDIDRFEMSVIFERLREINILLNQRLKKKNKVIKFCYLVKDDIFNSKDRVKFFDFIIPVVPIMNGSNIYEMFLNYFKEFNIDNYLINEVCKYISDIRILKNIYNEFLIYNKKTNKYLNTDYNQILSIVIYKNLFPKDFNDFNSNKGLLFNILGNVLLKKEILEDIENKLEKLKEKYKNEVNNIKEYILNNDENSLNDIDKYILYELNKELIISNIRSAHYLYDFFHKYYCKKNNISFDDDINYDIKFLDYSRKIGILTKLIEKTPVLIKLQHEILKLEYNYIQIKNNKFNKLCYENINELEALFAKFKKDLYIQDKHHYQFIKSLILSGFIDLSSKYYLANFNDEIFQKNDIDFILNVLKGENKLSYTYKLNNISLIVNFLDDCYYTTDSIFNFDLLDYLLDNSIGIIIFGNIDFKLKYFMYNLIQIKNFKFICEYYVRNINYSKKLMQKLEYGRYKFNNIKELDSNTNLFEEIISRNLYEINESNLITVLNKLCDPKDLTDENIKHKNYSLICNTKDERIYRYIHLPYNICTYLRVYINKLCDSIIKDDEEHAIVLIEILFMEKYEKYSIEYGDLFTRYIERLVTKIKLVSKIGLQYLNNYEKKILLYQELFLYKVVNCFVENIYEYYLSSNKMDEIIIKFINENSEELKFYNKCSDYDMKDIKSFLYELKSDERINEGKRIEIQSCIEELDKF